MISPSTIEKSSTRKAPTMSEFNLEVDTEKFNVVRRKLSFDCNQDLTSEEVINILIDNAYKVSQPKKRNRVDMNLILKEVENVATNMILTVVHLHLRPQ